MLGSQSGTAVLLASLGGRSCGTGGLRSRSSAWTASTIAAAGGPPLLLALRPRASSEGAISSGAASCAPCGRKQLPGPCVGAAPAAGADIRAPASPVAAAALAPSATAPWPSLDRQTARAHKCFACCCCFVQVAIWAVCMRRACCLLHRACGQPAQLPCTDRSCASTGVAVSCWLTSYWLRAASGERAGGRCFRAARSPCPAVGLPVQVRLGWASDYQMAPRPSCRASRRGMHSCAASCPVSCWSRSIAAAPLPAPRHAQQRCADTGASQVAATELAALHKELGALQPVVDALGAWERTQARSLRSRCAGARHSQRLSGSSRGRQRLRTCSSWPQTPGRTATCCAWSLRSRSSWPPRCAPACLCRALTYIRACHCGPTQ